MGRGKKKQRVDVSGGEELTSSPFAGLAGLRGQLPEGDPSHSEPSPAREAPSAAPAPRRAVVRFQHKGRGGKEVTLVEQLELPPAELARWLTELKRGLGCGGTIEGQVLVLQGDQRERLPELLRGKGVGRVSCS